MLFQSGRRRRRIQHFMEHLSGPVASWWKEPRQLYRLAGGEQENHRRWRYEGRWRPFDRPIGQMRDDVLLELVKIRTKQAQLSEPSQNRLAAQK